MLNINGGGATGGSPSGQVEHSDIAGPESKLPQANGGVPAKFTTYGIGSGTPQDGERGIGDMSKDKFGSMNGKAAGQTRDKGGREGLYNEYK